MLLYSAYLLSANSLLCIWIVVPFFKLLFYIKKSLWESYHPPAFPPFISAALAIAGSCFGKFAEITPHSSSMKCYKNREGVVLGGEGSSSLNGGISRNALETGFCNIEI